MHPLTLRFASAQAEAAFAADQAAKAARPARIALVGIFGLFLAIYVLTVHVFPGIIVGLRPEHWHRYLIGLFVTSGLFCALTYQPLFMRRQQWATALLVCTIWLGVVAPLTRVPASLIEARGYTGPMLYTFFIYSVFRLRIGAAIVCGMFGLALFVAWMLSIHAPSEIALGRSVLAVSAANVAGLLVCWQIEVGARGEFAAMQQLKEERARSERLLLNILPEAIAERLKHSGEAIAEHAGGVTVLFADIVGFTPLSASKSPQQLVDLLNRIFTEFDTLAEAHGLEKIKTIGDAYMAVAGLPAPLEDHAPRAARAALAMHQAIARVAHETGEPLNLRIGLHSGPVVAGVIGRRKFAYDLWGDTVNTASRMEAHGVPGEIHCTEATAALVRDAFRLQARGPLEIKGKGTMETYLLLAGTGA